MSRMNKLLVKYRSIPVQVKASLWFLICAFLQKGISFITIPIFTRLLSTSEYGQYNVFNSWMNIIIVIVTLNLFSGVYTRGLVKFEKDRAIFTSTLQGLTITLCFFWLIIYILFRTFWNNLFGLTTVQMLLMFILMWTTAVFSFWSTSQRVDFRYKKLVIVTLIVSLAKPFLGIVFVCASDDKVTARILGLALVQLVGYGVFFLLQMKEGRFFFKAFYWKHALSFNVPLIPHYLSTSVLSGADQIMIKEMIGQSQAGIYSLAYSLSMILTMLNSSLMQTIEPWMYKKINEGKVEDISKVAYPAFGVIAFANILLIAFAPEAVALFAPKDYYDAIYVIPPVAMSVFFMFSYTFFAVFEFYYKKTTLVSLATTGGAILNIVLNFLFIKIFGYYAAGYTTLICYIAYAVFHFVFMKKICDDKLNNTYPYNFKIYFGIVVGFIILGFTFLFLYKYLFLRYSLIVVICVGVIYKRKFIITSVRNIIMAKKVN